MVQINFARKEINCKLVYYGPGLSGKTTNLEKVHERTPQENKGELTSISTDGDRTLFFDFMPLDLGEIAGMKTKFHLYTVPGQVYYNSTRKLVLLGADGVIFVADSSRSKMADNLESLRNLGENLAEMGKDIATFPVVLQWNKRDMEDAATEEELGAELNPHGKLTFNAIASKGEGVFQTLKALSALVLKNISSTGGGMSSGSGNITSRLEGSSAAPAQPSQPSRSTQSAPTTSAPGAGFVIERNEIGAGASGATPQTVGSGEWSPADGALNAAAHAAPIAGGSPPAGTSGDDRRQAERRGPPGAAPGNHGNLGGGRAEPANAGQTARRPSAASAMAELDEAPAKRGADEVLAAEMNKRARTSGPESTLHREVKVIGGRPGGGNARAQSSGLSPAVIAGGVVAIAAAAGAAWFFLL